jgi:hypothetical protein
MDGDVHERSQEFSAQGGRMLYFTYNIHQTRLVTHVHQT